MIEFTTESDLPSLGELHVLLYRMSLEHGRLRPRVAAEHIGAPGPETESAAADLARLHLLRSTEDYPAEHGSCDHAPNTGCPAGHALEYAPRSPDAASVHLTGPITAQVQKLRTLADTLSGHVMAMKPVFDESWHGDFTRTSIEYLTTRDAIRNALERFSTATTAEAAAAHPDVPHPEALTEGLRRTTELIDRGVLMRTIYPHTVLTHAYMRRHLTKMSSLGAQVRTTSRVQDRVLFFDMSTAVLADHGPGSISGAVAVRDSSLVRFLYRAWENLWESAQPFGLVEADHDAAKEELHRAILKLLESGMKDEMAARRLAMSVTTYRRHVTELLGRLGARSRFQAGSYARQAGWLDD